MPCRYFPASVDLDAVTAGREEVADALIQQLQPGLDQQQRKRIIQWRSCKTAAACSNSGRKPDFPVHPSALECPVPPWKKGESGETDPSPQLASPGLGLLQSMALRAVYMPWLEADYCWFPMHVAAVTGSLKLARSLTRRNVTTALTCKDSAGNTPLMLACGVQSKKSLKLIKFLLARLPSKESRRAMVRQANLEGLTALHFAVLSSRLAVLQLLLKNGADPNAGTAEFAGTLCGMTPLHVCVISHQYKVDKMFKLAWHLMNWGADPNISAVRSRYSGPGVPTMRYECDCGGCWSRTTFASVLLVPPARFSLPEAPEMRKVGGVLHMGIHLGLGQHTIRDLWELSKVPVNLELRDHDGMTLLALAANSRSVSLIRFFASQGAQLRAQSIALSVHGTDSCPTILHKMCANWNIFKTECYFCQCAVHTDAGLLRKLSSAMGKLVDMEPEVLEDRDAKGRTPLHIASEYLNLTAFSKLLECGADPLVVDGRGRTPLYNLCLRNSSKDARAKEQMLELLLKHGVAHSILDQPYTDKKSPLKTVFKQRDFATLRKLHSAGGVSGRNLLLMLSELEANGAALAAEEGEVTPDGMFRGTVKYLLGKTPRRLEDLCLCYISARVPVASPALRRRQLRSVICLDYQLDRLEQLGLVEHSPDHFRPRESAAVAKRSKAIQIFQRMLKRS